MGQRHGLGVLAEAVAGQDHIGVPARQTEQHPAQPVHRIQDPEHALALDHIDAHRGQVARASSEMEPSPHLLAERPDQVLLARMQAAPRPRARRLHALRFHPAQRRQHGGARIVGHEPLLDEHDSMGFVEGVQRLQHRCA